MTRQVAWNTPWMEQYDREVEAFYRGGHLERLEVDRQRENRYSYEQGLKNGAANERWKTHWGQAIFWAWIGGIITLVVSWYFGGGCR